MNLVNANGASEVEMAPIFWIFLGVTCALIGSVGFISYLLMNHPYIISLTGGMALIAYGCCKCIEQHGIVRMLPASARSYFERVLHHSLFDFMYFNSGLSSHLRDWARLLLLQMDLTESEMSEVTRGMNCNFLDAVLRRNIIDILPPRVQTLLLPPSEQDGRKVEQAEVNGAGQVHQDSQVARVKIPPNEMLVRLLCEKKIQKEFMVPPPPLRPVTHFLIRNRLQAPILTLQNKIGFPILSSIVGFGADCFRASEYFSRLASIASICYPAASIALRGNHDMTWKKHSYAGICLVMSTSFSLFAYQLRKKYPWLRRSNTEKSYE